MRVVPRRLPPPTLPTDAEAAIVGRVAIQTGEGNSDEHAENARMYATTAATEAEKAEAVAEMAGDAKNADDARTYKAAAEAAQTAAEEAQKKAESERDEAVADAKGEVFVGEGVNGATVYRVDTTDITVGVGYTSKGSGGVMTETGEIDSLTTDRA